jgi:hypothetical protein
MRNFGYAYGKLGWYTPWAFLKNGVVEKVFHISANCRVR